MFKLFDTSFALAEKCVDQRDDIELLLIVKDDKCWCPDFLFLTLDCFSLLNLQICAEGFIFKHSLDVGSDVSSGHLLQKVKLYEFWRDVIDKSCSRDSFRTIVHSFFIASWTRLIPQHITTDPL